MTEALFNIIKKAVKLRLEKGENLEAILASYPNLSTSERDRLRNIFR